MDIDMKNLGRRLAVDSRDFCVACVVLPLVAFLLGISAVYYPVPLLALVIAGTCLGWVVFYRLLARADRQLHGRVATVVSFGAVSLTTAFGTGMMVAGPGSYEPAALALSFACGLIGAILFRQHQREARRAQASRVVPLLPAARR